jgi:hypothetical protein
LASRTKTPPPANRPANRTERRSQKKRKAPLALVVVPVLLIGAAVLIVLFMTGGKDIIAKVIPGGDEPVPAFDFKAAKVTVVPTAENANTKALQPAAEQASQTVVPVLDTLFTEAFLDPNNWKDGSYDEAWEEFSDAARPNASGADAETLTLGANAGDTYDTVSPDKGSIRFDVLFDRDGKPFSVAAHVKFYGLGEGKDGTYTAIVSHGVMFLRDTGNGWKVIGYDMKRNDHEIEPPAASTSPGANGGSSSGSGASGASS